MPDSSREEIAKLEALYASNPAGRVFTHLAEAYRKAGDFERARGILDEGILKHPGYASAYVVLGRVLLDLQEAEASAGAFRRVLELDPHNLVALRSLGDLARTAGRPAEALPYFEELRQHDPGNDEIEGITDELRSSAQEPVAEDAAETVDFETAPTEGYTPSAEPQFQPSETAEASPTEADEPWRDDWASSLVEESETIEVDYRTETVEAAAETPFTPDPITGEDFQLGWLEHRPDHAEEPATSDSGEVSDLPAASEADDRERVAPTDELGDLNSIGAAAQQFEVEGETFREEDLDFGMASAGLAEQPAAEGPPVEGEVVTETLAELYRQQGLHDRAADVYRALLDQRPGDYELEAKLAELEAKSLPVTEETADVEPERTSEPWETSDLVTSEESEEPDAEAAAAWLAGSSGSAESSPTPYAWTEHAAETGDDGGQPIGAYFQALLAWQPRHEPAMPVADVPASSAPETSGGSPAEVTTAGEAFDEWFGPADETPAEPAEPPPEASSPTAESEGDDDDDLEMFRSWLQSLKK